jgi:hypothetical protein
MPQTTWASYIASCNVVLASLTTTPLDVPRQYPGFGIGTRGGRSHIRPAAANNLGLDMIPSEGGSTHPPVRQEKMLLILIPVAWIAIVTFTVALCRMAARGDGQAFERAGSPAAEAGSPTGDGLPAWSDLDELVYGQRIPPNGVRGRAGAQAREPLVPAQKRRIAFPAR